MMQHLPILPILLPFLTGGVLMLMSRSGIGVQRVISVAGTLLLLAVAAFLVTVADAGSTLVYRLGDWQPPFGIVLVFDRMSALMLLLTAVIAVFSVLHAVQGDDEAGPAYHPLFQMQLAGLNGAFLTGDLFNLFVFFEILLIASYCLLVHGTTDARLRAGVHYVVLNLVGSALFLIAVGTLYGVTGTLNMADMAGRVAELQGTDAALVRSAALLLLGVFGLKAAIVPLYFWLPSAYAAATAPVAALFAIMTKVGVYSILRVYTLIFGEGAGVAAGVATPWLLPLALITLLLGMIGAVGTHELRRMQGYLLIGSVGIMLAAIALADVQAISAGLYYLVHSTLVMAALFLIADLIARQRGRRDDLIVRGPPVAQPAVLGALFFVAGVAVVGLPPLSGFLGKALILDAAVPHAYAPWIWGAILIGSLLAIIAVSRAGIMMFWDVEQDVDRDGVVDDHREPTLGGPWPARLLLPATGLLAAVVVMTVLAGPVTEYTRATATQLLDRGAYVDAVLGGAAVGDAVVGGAE